MPNPGEEFWHGNLLWLRGNRCRLHRLPFDAQLIAQAVPPPYPRETQHEAARSLGLKTGACATKGLDRQTLPLPAIAFLHANQAPGKTPIASVNGGKTIGKYADVRSTDRSSFLRDSLRPL